MQSMAEGHVRVFTPVKVRTTRLCRSTPPLRAKAPSTEGRN
jgi:hypothetical protein